MPLYLGPHQIAECQRCGLKHRRVELVEDGFVRNLLVCVECYDDDHPQLYPPLQRKEGIAPLRPAPENVGITPPVLSGEVDGDDANLTWTPALSNHSLITHYEIYRAELEEDEFILLDTNYVQYDSFGLVTDPGTSYVDDSADFDTLYYRYRVVAYATDASSVSNELPLAIPPTPPVLSIAAQGGGDYLLTWTEPTIAVVTVVGYTVYRSEDHGPFEFLATTDISPREYTDNVDRQAHRYDYYVLANSSLSGFGSDPSNIVTVHKVQSVMIAMSKNSDSFALYSSTQENWEAITVPASNVTCGTFVEDYDVDGGLFCFVGPQTSLTSRDGITWIKTTGITNIQTIERSGIAWSPVLRLFVYVADQGILTSPDGITWTLRSLPADHQPVGVIWSDTYQKFYVGCQDNILNAILTSPDGITWTVVGSPDTCYALAEKNGLIVCQVGRQGKAYISSDGVSFGSLNNVPGAAMHNIVYGNGVFVSVSDGGGGISITTSNGTSWNIGGASDVPAGSWDIPWFEESRGRFYCSGALGTSGQLVMTSVDGLVWSLESTPPSADSGSFRQIVGGLILVD